MADIEKLSSRFIFITGGVVSSLGKGLLAASIGALLQARNFKVRIRKFDPYLNIDPGTMSPIQHGEVFVTADGRETDLDLGYYERFTGVEATKNDSITSGRIYNDLLRKERNGEYLGQTVQVIPHVTNIIKSFIFHDHSTVDFVICEIGGTVGDIEGLPFLESIRQVNYQLGKSRTIFIHLTLVPYISAAKELKTKPTQHSVKELNSIGIQPNIILCRSERVLSQDHTNKIANFCNLSPDNVISALDVEDVYELPISYHKNGLDRQILHHFGITTSNPDLQKWENILLSTKTAIRKVSIAVVGKYTKIFDAYKSIFEALKHSTIHNKVKLEIRLLDSRKMDKNNVEEALSNVDGILIPGGFGNDGVEGKLLAINYARVKNVPFLGICMGMQLAVIEFSRNVVMLENANSTEFDSNCSCPVIKLIDNSTDFSDSILGKSKKFSGEMRLGSYDYYLKHGSRIAKIYNQEIISERCRNRYIVNEDYCDILEHKGLIFSGKSESLLEVIELPEHYWFIGTQFHPEFKSSPFAAHPLFVSFIKHSIESRSARIN